MLARTHPLTTAAWLAQLVERQSAVREVEGPSPKPDQHSGSYNNWGECAAFVIALITVFDAILTRSDE